VFTKQNSFIIASNLSDTAVNRCPAVYFTLDIAGVLVFCLSMLKDLGKVFSLDGVIIAAMVFSALLYLIMMRVFSNDPASPLT
jgi:hypothetical protein